MSKNIDTGNWPPAYFKSVLWLGALYLIPFLYNVGFGDGIGGPIAILILFVSVYLAVIIIGWIFVGYPIHYLCCKYFKSSVYSYILLVLIFTGFLALLFGLQASLPVGLHALILALIFWYYMYIKKI